MISGIWIRLLLERNNEQIIIRNKNVHFRPMIVEAIILKGIVKKQQRTVESSLLFFVILVIRMYF